MRRLRPLLRTPERSLGILEARRGLSSSPQPAPTMTILHLQPARPARFELRLRDKYGNGCDAPGTEQSVTVRAARGRARVSNRHRIPRRSATARSALPAPHATRRHPAATPPPPRWQSFHLARSWHRPLLTLASLAAGRAARTPGRGGRLSRLGRRQVPPGRRPRAAPLAGRRRAHGGRCAALATIDLPRRAPLFSPSL